MKTVKSDLICSECGNLFPIQRKNHKRKDIYHIKDLFCINCKKVTKHIEVIDVDLLKKLFEFNYDNLSSEDQIVYNLINNKNKQKVLK